jgi:hypothetical protein
MLLWQAKFPCVTWKYNMCNKTLVPFWNFVELHKHNKPNTGINISKGNKDFYNTLIAYITRNITDVLKRNHTYVKRILLQKLLRKLFKTHRLSEGTTEVFQWLHYILRPGCQNIQIELTWFYGINVFYPNAP